MTSPNLPSLPVLDIETSCSKWRTQFDLKEPTDVERLHTLLRNMDVFLLPRWAYKAWIGPRGLHIPSGIFAWRAVAGHQECESQSHLALLLDSERL